MPYTITTADAGLTINFSPQTVVEEVLQNISTLLSTIKNTVPLDRNFGLSARFVDKPTPVAEAILISEIMDVIEQYEPRAEILDITFERNEMTGILRPRLEVEIHGG